MPISGAVKVDWHRQRRAQQRERAIKYLGGECVRCGDVFNLEFDHIDPATKTYKISDNRDYSWGRLVEEVKKCQLLCKPCHKQKTMHNEDWDVA